MWFWIYYSGGVYNIINMISMLSIILDVVSEHYVLLLTSRAEHVSSAVECETRSQVGPGSNHLCCHLKVWAFSFTHDTSVHSRVKMRTWKGCRCE